MTHLTERRFDTRLICTVNRANIDDCLQLLDLADQLGVTLVKFHVFSTIGLGSDAEELSIAPHEWIAFYERLEEVSASYATRVWYQPTYARRDRVDAFGRQGFAGCIGRSLDRISVFPDGRSYVCSYLFDTDLHFGTLNDGHFELNRGRNELELFANTVTRPGCDHCVGGCQGGCPAEAIVMGASSCSTDPDIVPVCRLWKAMSPRR